MKKVLGDKTGSSRCAPEAASASSPSVTIPIAPSGERVKAALKATVMDPRVGTTWGDDETENRIALAAIAALREPTDRQVMAALAWGLDWMKENGVDHLSPYEDFPNVGETTRGMWRAMIDAALSDV